MKKALLVMLAFVLLAVSAFSALADEGNETEAGAEARYEYTAIDAEAHHVVITTQTEDGESKEEFDEPHDYGMFGPETWSSNQCFKCGYACQHPSGFIERTDYNPAACEFEPVDENTHRVIDKKGVDIATFSYCPICNLILEDSDTKLTEYVEAHRFDEDGLCIRCNYQKSNSSEEPNEEPKDEPGEKPSEEPLEESNEEPVEEPGKEPADGNHWLIVMQGEPTEAPTPEPTSEPTPEPTAAPTTKPESGSSKAASDVSIPKTDDRTSSLPIILIGMALIGLVALGSAKRKVD